MREGKGTHVSSCVRKVTEKLVCNFQRISMPTSGNAENVRQEVGIIRAHLQRIWKSACADERSNMAMLSFAGPFTEKSCPAMCNKCETTTSSTAAPDCCDDDEAYAVECPEWSVQGYCDGTGTSASFMALSCARTCGSCDSQPSCATTAAPRTTDNRDGSRTTGQLRACPGGQTDVAACGPVLKESNCFDNDVLGRFTVMQCPLLCKECPEVRETTNGPTTTTEAPTEPATTTTAKSTAAGTTTNEAAATTIATKTATATTTTKTATTKTVTTTTDTPCHSDLVFLVDRSSSQAFDSNGDLRTDGCNVLQVVKLVLKEVSRRLAKLRETSGDTVQVGAIAYDRSADVLLDFDDDFTPSGVNDLDMTFKAGPTLAAEALKLARTKLDSSNDGDDDSSSNDRFKVMVVFSDGNSLNKPTIAEELELPYHTSFASRFIIDTEINRGGSADEPDLFEMLSKPSTEEYAKVHCSSNVDTLATQILASVPASGVGGWQCGGAADGTTATAVATTATPTDAPDTTTTAAGDTAAAVTVQSAALLVESQLAIEGTGIFAIGLGSGKGTAYLMAGSGGLVLQTHPAAVSSDWSIGIEMEQTRGSSGYLFAKTGASGVQANRYYALYSTSSRVTLYYRHAGGASRAHFRTSINTGLKLQVTLSVRGRTAALVVQRPGGTSDPIMLKQKLKGPVTDCGEASADCTFSLGQRRDDDGGSSGVFFFTGTLFSASMLSNTAVTQLPGIDALPPSKAGTEAAIESGTLGLWLDPSNHEGQAPARGDAYFFSGQGAVLKVTNHGDASDTGFTIAVDFLAAQPSSGYLFAKTDSTGDVRYYGLYMSSLRKDLVFYFRTHSFGRGVSSVQQSERFGVDLTDGRRYQVVLTVRDGQTAALRVDGVLIGGERNLGGTIADCGSPADECNLFLGQRADDGAKNYPFVGIMYDARMLDGAAITAYPRV